MASATLDEYLATQIESGHINGLTHLLDQPISKVALFDFPAENSFSSFQTTRNNICKNAGRNPDHIALFALIECHENEDFYYRVDEVPHEPKLLKRIKRNILEKFGKSPALTYHCRYPKLTGDDIIKVKGTWLGAELTDGGRVVTVIPGSPAHEAGVKMNDTLTKFCSEEISPHTKHHTFGEIVKSQRPGAMVTAEILKTSVKWTRPFHVIEDGKHYVPVIIEYKQTIRLNCDPQDFVLGDKKLNWIDLTHKVTLREWADQFRTIRYDTGVHGAFSKFKTYCSKKVKVEKLNICQDLALDLFRFFVREGEKEIPEIPECPKCNPQVAEAHPEPAGSGESCESCFVCQTLAAKGCNPAQIEPSMLRPFRKAEIGDIVSTKWCGLKSKDMAGKRSVYDRTGNEYLQELCLMTRLSTPIEYESYKLAVSATMGSGVRPETSSRDVMIRSSKPMIPYESKHALESGWP